MDRLHSWEFSPAVSVSKLFTNGISVAANVSYTWGDEKGGDLTAQKSVRLPSVVFDDYVEYGLTVQQRTEKTNWALGVNRNDQGREGWNVHAYYAWQF